MIKIIFIFWLFFQRGMRELIDSGRYDTHDNFTVILQPFMREIYLPRLEVRADQLDTIKAFLSIHLFEFHPGIHHVFCF